MTQLLKIAARLALMALLAAVILTGATAAAQAQPNPQELSKAVAEIEDLDAMRINRAASLEGATEPPTLDTFKAVCKPIGMRAKQLGQENGWVVKQLAEKYRNPAHGLDSETAELAIARFKQDSNLFGFWEQEQFNGQSGARYYRRIDVQASCLACHGAKESRPAFVKERYPDDRAYDFEVGDLRGMYAVFIPETKAALQAALTQ